MGQPFLGVADLGDVGADTAEAFEMPAVSMIGSPAIDTQRVPRAVFNSMSSELNGCFSSRMRPNSALPPSKRGANGQAARLPVSKQCRHTRRDVGYAVLGIDLP